MGSNPTPGTSRQGDEGKLMAYDDDDWVGEPPEGHHTRDRADPGFWSGQRPLGVAGAGLGLALIVLLIALLL